ncbi:MAG: DUF2779 domain-containing protein [Burkholderiaceae bacterium]|nr:DUF2779 domain-containing protein [Burkholderiaceae bacterium]
MLSKSRILNGLQCPKRLYLQVHRPDLAEVDAATEHRFQVGHEVGDVARTLQPGGKLMADDDLNAALAATERELAMPGDKVLFEAAVAHGGVLIRADILSRRAGDAELREVKSSTSVKDYHQPDVAVQVWTLRGAGVRLSRSFVTHIDNAFVYQGEGQYGGLLRDTDVSVAVGPDVGKVPGWVEQFSRVLDGAMPAVEMGAHCTDPFECPFQGHCSAGRPAFPVEILPRGGKTVVALREAGHRDLREVPEGMLKSANHLRVWRATISGQADIVRGAGAEVAALPYPRYYVDFETAQMAVPIWAGTRPYEQLPFQWSCHLEKSDGSLEQRGFLDLSGRPPMRTFAESLIGCLGTSGPVFSYSSFERTILAQSVVRFPDLAESIGRIMNRIVDLRPLAERSYYHPQMMGSWSIKSVIPTIAPELDYAALGEVQEGGQAQVAYLEAIHPNTLPERRQSIERDLTAYCARDTLAMVRLARFLMEQC